MRKIAFTLSSNNYLAQVSLLVHSFVKENPGFDFYIGLVDKKDEKIAYPSGENVQVIPCEDVVPAQLFQDMVKKYKIVELNTSVKPFYFDYFFSTNEDCKVIYLDPDIYVYNSFQSVTELLDSHDILITPHIISPIPLDGEYPSERLFMKYGIYNFGFLAMRKSEAALSFTKWWMDRLAVLCYSEIQLGVFVDQSWAAYLPVFSNRVHISRNPGWNAAFWNLHERRFKWKGDRCYVNEDSPLLFFHFSSFPLSNVNQLTKRKVRYSLADRPDLRLIFEDYAARFREAKKVYSSDIPCVYTSRTLNGKIFYYLNRYRIRKKLKE